jgi:sugar lactone lactonase YvrE
MSILRSGSIRPRLTALALFCGFCAAALVSLDAASTSFWLVSTQAEFIKGEVEQLSIDSDGRVTLGPAIESLKDTATPAVWRIVTDADDSVWAGTGNEGKVIKFDRNGKSTIAFDAIELEIHALAPGRDGVMFAGSSPDGRVYKITRDGKAVPFFDPDDKYIWSLLVAPDGTLYAGTGDKGRVYKIAPDGKGTLLYDSGATHATALAWDPKANTLLVGTASPGRVVRVDATGKGFVLLESGYKEIHTIRVSATGTIFATAVGGAAEATSTSSLDKLTTDTSSTPIPVVSTEVTVTAFGDTAVVTPSSGGSSRSTSPRDTGSQKGAVFRINPDGEWDQLWDSTSDSPYDLLIEPNGALLVATGDKGKIFRISGSPTITTLVTRATSQQITSFAQDKAGRIYYAASNPGRLFRITNVRADRGTYLSDVKDTATVSTWGAIRWRAETPSGTGVQLFTRSGNTKAPDASWSDWSKAYTNAAGEPIASPKARYLQWKAALTGSSSATPILTSVTTAYLPRNSRPTVTSITVHPPGVVFQRPFPTGDPELAGFDSGTSDGRPSTLNSGTSLGSSSTGPALGRRTFQKSLQTFVWRAEDQDEDRMQFDVWYRREGETEWKLLKHGLWDSIYTWDTTSVPDGTYSIKIVASDGPSNAPPAALNAERESPTFEIDNTPPTIIINPAATGATASFTVRDSHSPIQRVEYSTNAGGWRLLYPVDGLLDSAEEQFELTRERDVNEPIVLRATDALGNVATAVLPPPGKAAGR